jgi:hypothetical protein
MASFLNRTCRYYIISRLRTLEVLDSTVITAKERSEALRIYGNLGVSIAKEEEERKRLKELEEKRQEEALMKRKKVGPSQLH